MLITMRYVRGACGHAYRAIQVKIGILRNTECSLYVVWQILGSASLVVKESFYVGLVAYGLFAGFIVQAWRQEIEADLEGAGVP